MDQIEALRKKGIVSLFVAYGDGIKEDSRDLFLEFAQKGSCPNNDPNDKDCHSLMEPKTPEELKQQLTK